MNEFLNSWRFSLCIAVMLVLLAIVGGPENPQPSKQIEHTTPAK